MACAAQASGMLGTCRRAMLRSNLETGTQIYVNSLVAPWTRTSSIQFTTYAPFKPHKLLTLYLCYRERFKLGQRVVLHILAASSFPKAFFWNAVRIPAHDTAKKGIGAAHFSSCPRRSCRRHRSR